jgi:long-chain acyl-CoA synthetase
MSFDPLFRDLNDLFHRSIAQYAERPLFGTKRGGTWTWTTYGDFGREVDRVRAGLASLGVGAGDRVAIIANNRVEWAALAHATYGLGAAYVPMYEAQQADEWRYILSDSGARVVFVANEAIARTLSASRAQLPSVEHLVSLAPQPGSADSTYEALRDRGRHTAVAVVPAEANTPATFLYTSGTTGNPKGVILSHANIALNVSAVHEVFPMSAGGPLAVVPPVGALVRADGASCTGSSRWARPSPSAESVPTHHAEPRGGAAHAPVERAAHLQPHLRRVHKKQMAEEGGRKQKLFRAALANSKLRKDLAGRNESSGVADLQHVIFDRVVFSHIRGRFGGKLKYAFSGGAAISREVAEFIDGLGIPVYEGYGLTETSPIATMNYPGSRKIGSVGKVLPGVRIEIDRAVTGDPQHGEVVVFGHNVMLGYHGLPEANAEVFVERKGERGLRTGDMGYLDGEGYLHITGRIKEQYKLENGKFVVPTPLEEQLKLSPYISNVMLFGENREYNVAVIVPDFDLLLPWCAQHRVPATAAEAVRDPRVRDLFERELDRQSGEFRHFEKVRKFVLVTEEFSTENGMLTPTLKVKRGAVLAAHGEALAALYA